MLGYGDKLEISEVTGVGIKIDIYDGEVTGTTLGDGGILGEIPERGMGIGSYGGIGDMSEEIDESSLGD